MNIDWNKFLDAGLISAILMLIGSLCALVFVGLLFVGIVLGHGTYWLGLALVYVIVFRYIYKRLK